MSGRRFEFRKMPSLPRMAWCARVSPDSVTVSAGEWVFTGDGWFAEGAWNGPLAQGDFSQATYFTGSGGVVKSDQLMFCTPSHVFEHLYSAHHDGEFVISNSLVFLMTEARIELDYAYPNYIFDVSQARRTGILRGRTHCRVASTFTAASTSS